MATSKPTVEILQASIDEDDLSEFRLLVGDQHIKYLSIDSGIFDTRTMAFGPSLLAALPPFPSTDWNTGRLFRKNSSDQLQYHLENQELHGVHDTWHPVKVDYLDLELGEKLRTNVYEARCKNFESEVIAKFARFTWEIPMIDHETQVYEWIEGHNIGPKFLGHITEHGRVIGFLIERVTEFRHATAEDLTTCQNLLSRLHGLQIRHGDTNKHNFLITSERTVLIDFDCALKTLDKDGLHEEIQNLQAQLNDTSGLGGEYSDSDNDDEEDDDDDSG